MEPNFPCVKHSSNWVHEVGGIFTAPGACSDDVKSCAQVNDDITDLGLLWLKKWDWKREEAGCWLLNTIEMLSIDEHDEEEEVRRRMVTMMTMRMAMAMMMMMMMMMMLMLMLMLLLLMMMMMMMMMLTAIHYYYIICASHSYCERCKWYIASWCQKKRLHAEDHFEGLFPLHFFNQTQHEVSLPQSFHFVSTWSTHFFLPFFTVASCFFHLSYSKLQKTVVVVVQPSLFHSPVFPQHHPTLFSWTLGLQGTSTCRMPLGIMSTQSWISRSQPAFKKR